MSRHDPSESDLRDGELGIRLRRGERRRAGAPAQTPAPPPAPAAAAAPAAEKPADEPVKASKPLHLIKSPTPGTFYAAPDPNAEPFVRVGTRVTPTTVVCVIEAM